MNRFLLTVLLISVFASSCSKNSSDEDDRQTPPSPSTGNNAFFTVKIGNATYNLDSFSVIETSLGYYIRAIQKTNLNYGIDLFVNTKTATSATGISFDNLSAAQKAYMSTSFGSDQNLSTQYTDPVAGEINSDGSVVLTSIQNIIKGSFKGKVYNQTSFTAQNIEGSFEMGVKPNNPNNEFFQFSFGGNTYDLGNLMVAPTDKGYYVTGFKMDGTTPTGFGVNVFINTKSPTPNIGVPFGGLSDDGKGSVSFSLELDKAYASERSDCESNKIYSGGSVKLTKVEELSPNKKAYIEGNFSGATAYEVGKSCTDKKPGKPMSGYFKILRRF